MITAVTLGIAFAWERAEGDVMLRPPRQVDEPLLTGFVLWRIGFVGLVLLLGVGFLFLHEQGREGTTLDFARTVAVNALVMGQIFYLIATRHFDRTSLSVEGLTGNRAVLIAISVCIALQLLFTYVPVMNTLFGTAPLDAAAWGRCIAVGVAVLALVEIEKAVRRGWLGTSAASGGNATASQGT
jgi:magnesium-transporting ATPase (P-type)